jgi:hypothetical protein
MKTARWANGTRAWLDSRGMLHLKPAGASEPEVSLLLAEGPMAAWSSDGKICGPAFFVEDRANAEPATLIQHINSIRPTA